MRETVLEAATLLAFALAAALLWLFGRLGRLAGRLLARRSAEPAASPFPDFNQAATAGFAPALARTSDRRDGR
ncbi:hypothetical protein [Roseicella frigidaeris]|uniref:Uncharacterized protein n=1 Tax=Roseicella frigidaeris TaxID=2230885 RepID=A0A327MA42_9PROT|nr:hypothetical protein [Roseicella frigidaeris]RAI59306.1 hypothetical protein DOO78_09775 [Roseicella frigidaeris]